MLWSRFGTGENCAPEQFHEAVLAICDQQDADESILGDHFLDPVAMGLGVFLAGTEPHVDRILKHQESVLDHAQAKVMRIFALLLGLGWEIEQDNDPHIAVLIQPVGSKRLHIVGTAICVPTRQNT